MFDKLAGKFPLQDMVTQVLSKVASAEEEKKDEKKPFPPKATKKDEKKDEAEKTASALSFEGIEKLASALEVAGEDLQKEADAIENGGESKQGGEQLATQSPTKGKQNYVTGKARTGQVPMSTGMQSDPSQGPSKTQVPNDANRAPGGPGKQKVSAAQAVLARISAATKTAGELPAALAANKEKVEKAQTKEPGAEKPDLGAKGKKEDEEKKEKKAFAVTREGHKLDAKRYGAISKANHDMGKAEDDYAKEAPGKALLFRGALGAAHRISARHSDYAAKKHEEGKNAYNPFGGMATKSRHEKAEEGKTKKSAARTYLLNKIAETQQGGEVLSDDKVSVKVPSNPGRQLIQSPQAITNATRAAAKAPVKKQLSAVLSEPAQSKATDPVVHNNLQNASKGGVKIAAAREALKKIAGEGCKCDGKGECQYCKLKKAAADKK